MTLKSSLKFYQIISFLYFVIHGKNFQRASQNREISYISLKFIRILQSVFHGVVADWRLRISSYDDG